MSCTKSACTPWLVRGAPPLHLPLGGWRALARSSLQSGSLSAKMPSLRSASSPARPVEAEILQGRQPRLAYSLVRVCALLGAHLLLVYEAASLVP